MSASTDIISFYSFKGGTGRSTALANVAYELAESGLTVGCMDLDLAAPGLHMIFPNVGPPYGHATKIHDYLRGNEQEVRNIDNYIIDVGERIGKTRHDAPSGELLLIAGDIEPPGSGNPREMMARALELREDFIDRENLDYLLIDSRSGLSNHMIPLFDKADRFLAFHRWTFQHKTGTERLAEWLDKVPSPDDMMSVASNVPVSVDDSEIESWAMKELYRYNFSAHHIINTSNILREKETIVALEDDSAPVTEQFRSLADRLSEN